MPFVPKFLYRGRGSETNGEIYMHVRTSMYVLLLGPCQTSHDTVSAQGLSRVTYSPNTEPPENTCQRKRTKTYFSGQRESYQSVRNKLAFQARICNLRVVPFTLVRRTASVYIEREREREREREKQIVSLK